MRRTMIRGWVGMAINAEHISILRRELWLIAGKTNHLYSPFVSESTFGEDGSWKNSAVERAINNIKSKSQCPVCLAALPDVKAADDMLPHLLGGGDTQQCKVIKAGHYLHRLHNLDNPDNAVAIEALIKENPYNIDFPPAKAQPEPQPRAAKPAKAPAKKPKSAKKPKKSVAAKKKLAHPKTRRPARDTAPAAGVVAQVDEATTVVLLEAPVSSVTPAAAEPVMTEAPAPVTEPAAMVAATMPVNQEEPGKAAVMPMTPRAPSPADERFQAAFVDLLEEVAAPAEAPVVDRLYHLPKFDDSFNKVTSANPGSIGEIEKKLAQMLNKSGLGG